VDNSARTNPDLASEIAALTWYHTIELPSGVVTPGEYDTRAAARRIPFPTRLDGKRCLDVGTHDGFWAFEMERRGAAEVMAIDLDDPRQVDVSEPSPVWTGELLADRTSRPLAFSCAHRALDSKVTRRDQSVYRLDRNDVGKFDFAFIGTLLLHLREPVKALTAIRNVLAPGGRLLVNDPVSLGMTIRHPRRPVHQLILLPGKPFWWLPNTQGLKRYVEKAGFQALAHGGPYLLPRGPGYARPPHRGNILARALQDRGMLHGWVVGKPA
jgi:tRNA (mo5U34)-methyltransferase